MHNSEEQFRQLANSIPHLAWMADGKGWLYWYNQRWFDYTGTTLADMEGWGWQKIHHPDHVDRVTEKWKKTFLAGENWEDTFPLRGVDGEYRWFLSRAYPIRDSKGNILRWFGTNTDITQQRESEERFRQLANSMPHVVWTARPDGQLDYINDRCFSYSGTVKTENGTVDWTSIVHPEDLANTVKVWAECVQTGKSYEVHQRILHAESGQYRWNLTRALPVRNDKGHIIRWYGTNTDITNERRLHAVTEGQKLALEMSMKGASLESILELLVRVMEENANSGVRASVLVISEDKKYLLKGASPSLPEAYNAAIDGLEIGDGVGSCGTAAYLSKPYVARDIATDPYWKDFKDLALSHNLRACWSTPIFSTSGELLGTFALYYDKPTDPSPDEHEIVEFLSRTVGIIIERARLAATREALNSQLIEARNIAEAANKAKSEFLANMSHEIRTPLNAIIGVGHILTKSSPLSERQAICIKTLQTSSESLLMLINDLLDLAKLESEYIQLENIPFQLRHLVEETVDMLRFSSNEKKISLILNYDKNLQEKYIGDPHRLKQILTNLTSNAIKFTDRGGVTISVKAQSETDNLLNVAIHVADTGIGIPTDKLENIFRKFSQADTSISRKYGGTGLGLAISKTLAEIMGGDISVTSCQGIGSEFTLKLPLVKDHASLSKRLAEMFSLRPGNAASQNPMVSSSQPCVLIVEDYKPNLLVATSYMEMFGYRYEAAQNGEEAIQKAQSGTYDAILMDVQMPGMDGLSATRAIREWEKQKNLKHVPIIGITAYALTGDREKCLAAGMDDYLSKPFTPQIFKEKIARLINKGGANESSELLVAV